MKFKLQRFNDTITSSMELKVGMRFADADTRLITIPDPVTNIDATAIKAAFNSAITNNIFIGDKTGASITGLYTAYVDDTTRLKLDISGN